MTPIALIGAGRIGGPLARLSVVVAGVEWLETLLTRLSCDLSRLMRLDGAISWLRVIAEAELLATNDRVRGRERCFSKRWIGGCDRVH